MLGVGKGSLRGLCAAGRGILGIGGALVVAFMPTYIVLSLGPAIPLTIFLSTSERRGQDVENPVDAGRGSPHLKWGEHAARGHAPRTFGVRVDSAEFLGSDVRSHPTFGGL
jgi:hypothetical protein